jgi:hypothetical protein
MTAVTRVLYNDNGNQWRTRVVQAKDIYRGDTVRGWRSGSVCTVSQYVCVCVCMCVCIYVYIYIEREREEALWTHSNRLHTSLPVSPGGRVYRAPGVCEVRVRGSVIGAEEKPRGSGTRRRGQRMWWCLETARGWVTVKTRNDRKTEMHIIQK